MLDAHKLIDISAGHDHNAVVTSLGQVFTWGRNTYGELGRDKSGDLSIKLVPSLTNYFVVQVRIAAILGCIGMSCLSVFILWLMMGLVYCRVEMAFNGYVIA